MLDSLRRSKSARQGQPEGLFRRANVLGVSCAAPGLRAEAHAARRLRLACGRLDTARRLWRRAINDAGGVPPATLVS